MEIVCGFSAVTQKPEIRLCSQAKIFTPGSDKRSSGSATGSAYCFKSKTVYEIVLNIQILDFFLVMYLLVYFHHLRLIRIGLQNTARSPDCQE